MDNNITVGSRVSNSCGDVIPVLDENNLSPLDNFDTVKEIIDKMG